MAMEWEWNDMSARNAQGTTWQAKTHGTNATRRHVVEHETTCLLFKRETETQRRREGAGWERETTHCAFSSSSVSHTVRHTQTYTFESEQRTQFKLDLPVEWRMTTMTKMLDCKRHPWNYYLHMCRIRVGAVRLMCCEESGSECLFSHSVETNLSTYVFILEVRDFPHPIASPSPILFTQSSS